MAKSSDPAYATDAQNRIVAWNAAAEGLLGHRAQDVVGRVCHEVTCGVDIFRNPFCMPGCTIGRTAREGRRVFPFELFVKRATGELLRAHVSIVVVPGPRGPSGSEPFLVHLLRTPSEPGPETGAGGAELLTKRETQILRLLASGIVVKSIAGELGVSVPTVRAHVRNALKKMGAHSQIEAVAQAFRRHLI